MKKAVYVIAVLLVVGLLVFAIMNKNDKDHGEESTIVCSEKDKC